MFKHTLVLFGLLTSSVASAAPLPNQCSGPPKMPDGWAVTKILRATSVDSSKTKLVLDKNTKIAASQQGYVLTCGGAQLPVGRLRMDDPVNATLDGGIPSGSLDNAWVAIWTKAATLPVLAYEVPSTYVARSIYDYQGISDDSFKTRVTFRRGDVLPGDGYILLGKDGRWQATGSVDAVTTDEATARTPLAMSELGSSGYASRIIATNTLKKCTIPNDPMPASPDASWSVVSVMATGANNNPMTDITLKVTSVGARKGLLPGSKVYLGIQNQTLKMLSMSNLSVVESRVDDARIVIRNAPSTLVGQSSMLRLVYKPALCK